MKPAYKWRPGSQIKVDANKAGQRIELLQHQHNGKVTAEEVLEDAKAESSPLHGAFEWDDTEAAKEWRLGQARHLLASLEIDIKIMPGAPVTPTRAFVNVDRGGGSKYVTRSDALANKNHRAQLVENGWRELESWCDRHRTMAEFEKVIAALEHEMRFRQVS